MSRADVVPIAEGRTKRHSYPPLTICDTHGWGYFTSLWPPSALRGPKSTRVMQIRLVFVLMERATLTSRVHGARMCLTIKLFWVKSALISFHSISVLQGSLVRERSAEITCFKHAGTLARYPSGLANPHLQGFIAGLAKSSRPRHRLSGAIGSPFHTG